MANRPVLGRAARQRPCRVLVLVPGGDTDAASDAALRATLGDLSHDQAPGETLQVVGHASGADLGSVLRRVAFDGAADVAWIEAGQRVMPGWRSRLQSALAADEALATVCPLSLDDPGFSPLPSGHPGLPVDSAHSTPSAQALRVALSDWLQAHAPGEPLELIGPLSACGVLRAEALVDLCSAVSNPRDWGRELSARGWCHGVSRQVLCWHETGRPARGRAPASTLLAEPALWAAAHPLTGLRHAVGEVLKSGTGLRPAGVPVQALVRAPVEVSAEASVEPPGSASTARRPVRLHIAHSWGGGLAKWVRDFIHTDEAQGTGRGLVLRSVGIYGAFGQRLALYEGADDIAPLRFWELGVPIHATATAHLEVRAILREIIDDFGVEQVLVSSLIGHSLDVLRTGLPTLLVAHDHHPFCITLYASFEGECRECSPNRLRQCMAGNPGHRFFQGVSAEDWLDLRRCFVGTVMAQRLPIVAPTPSVAQRWQSMMPDLYPSLFRVVAHGLPMAPMAPVKPPADGPLRVLVLGRLSPEKGVHLLEAMRQPLQGFATLLLLGCGEDAAPAWRSAGATVVPSFDASELPTRLTELQPHVGLLMSTVPETFSYALSELWHAGIPVVATDCGALADRIEDGVTGFVEPLEADALLQRLRELDRDRDQLTAMRQRVAQIPPRDLKAMVADYASLLPLAAQGPNGATAARGATGLDDGRLGPDSGSSVDGQGRTTRGTTPLRDTNGPMRHRRALHVNPEVTWRQAARGFWQYTCWKASRSPRLPAWVQAWFARRG